jgi:anti-sigma regulatory factor (Ser/Thr protein kinase)
MLTSTPVLGEVTIPGCEQSVRRARAFVRRILGPLHPRMDDACLLVSELVTNAVQHTESRRPGGVVTVTILEVTGALRVEVTDEGSARSVPVVKDDVFADSGRGLFLVQSVADDWGYQHYGPGTTVWFRLIT